MMLRHQTIVTLFFITIFISGLFPLMANQVLAALPTVKNGDLIEFGYTLVVDGKIIEKYSETKPVAKRVTSSNIRPPGLYKALLGMTLNQPKDVVVPPEDGFTDDDVGYENLVGKTLYYYGLEVFSINGKYITDFNTASNGLSSFGYYFVRILLGILVLAAVIGLGYGSFWLYKKVFAKRCVVCKKPADGKCKKCGRYFCKTCYAMGCPYCGSRKLILFK